MNKRIIIIIGIVILALIICGIAIFNVTNSSGEKIKNIGIDSKEGQECIIQLKEYLQNQNEDYKNIEILKIEKHEHDIIGDGYAMGTDKKPAVIGHNLFYYITIKNNYNNYIYMYRPDGQYKIKDVSYQFN